MREEHPVHKGASPQSVTDTIRIDHTRPPSSRKSHQSQPYPYQPPQPAKKKKKWPWIVGVIVVLIVIGSAIGSGGDGGDNSNAAAPATAKSPAAAAPAPVAPAPVPASEPAAGLNTPVRDGKFEFVVTNVETGLSSVGDNPYLQQHAQGQYVVVTMTVQNTSDEPKSLSPGSQLLYDTQGRKFESDSMANIAVGGDIPVWDNINPGNKVTAKVVYDMPAGAKPDHVVLHDSMFSGGVTVGLNQ